MRKMISRVASAAACALLVTACNSPLDVTNLNSADVARAYSTPANVESLVGQQYLQFHNAWMGSSDAIHVQSHQLAFEGYATVANFGMNIRAAIPRSPISNDRGNQSDAGNNREYSAFQRVSRTSANLVQALDRIMKANQTTGTLASDYRDRGFALMGIGLSLGYVALAYDSAAIVDHTVGSDVIPALSGYAAVGAKSLALLDSALAWGGSATAAAAFPLPSGWLSTNSMSQADWVRFVRSQKARIRAGLARDGTERAAVDWTSVIADATNGISANVVLQMGGSWSCAFDCSQMYVTGGWHEFPLPILGMADTSGAYKTYITTAVGGRDGASVLIRTPDARFPAGATRAAQQAAAPVSGTALPAGIYIGNRASGDDFPGDGWGSSQYDHRRWLNIRAASGTGPMVVFAKAENDMLAAEGYIRKGDLASAATLINASRTLHGLPAINTPASATASVTGSFSAQGCVPQVPNATSSNVACGSILEAMKWEKRMETAYTGFMSWYLDARGWNDLPEFTAQQWPIPNKEMDSRLEAFYNMGGSGGKFAAPKGTYGF